MVKSFITIYIVFIGIALGVEIAAGAFVAPVIFHPERYLGTGVLTHFQSGILMTQVFLKTNMLMSIVALYSIAYELLAWMKKHKDSVSLVLSFSALILTSLFVFYYTTFIVDAQILGAQATATPEFAKMHQESEWVIKILMMVQIVLLFRKMRKIQER